MATATRFIPLALVAALSLAGCAGTADSSDTPSTQDGVPLVEAATLTICTNPPFEPFEYNDADGNVVGMDIDISKEIATTLGVELAVKVTPFEGIQSGADLNTGNCDIVASGLTINPERQAKMDFSDPYFDADQGLLVAEGSDLGTVESLEGKRIAVQQGTTGEAWVAEHGLQAVQFEELGLQIQALETGQVDAVITDVSVMRPFVDEGYEIAATFPTGEQYGLAVKQGNDDLLKAVNETLDRLKADGTYDTIYTTHIGMAPTNG